MDQLAAIVARIRNIEQRFGVMPTGGAGGRLGQYEPKSVEATNFTDALARAKSISTETLPAETGKLNKAGVDPVKWSRDFLDRIGTPVTGENMRAMLAWQKAEGTAAKFNPLATTQPGFAGSTNFNRVGVKNFASYADGIAANAKVINNGKYGNILAALRAGTSAEAVGQAIADSPWGSGNLVLEILRSQSR
jgi:hypothetical protein